MQKSRKTDSLLDALTLRHQQMSNLMNSDLNGVYSEDNETVNRNESGMSFAGQTLKMAEEPLNQSSSEMDSRQSQQIGETQPKFKINNLGPSNSDISMIMQPLNPAFQQVPLRALNIQSTTPTFVAPTASCASNASLYGAGLKKKP
jgi:hypothetical protein